MNRAKTTLAALGLFCLAAPTLGQAIASKADEPAAEQAAEPTTTWKRSDPFEQTGLDRPPPVVPDPKIQTIFEGILEQLVSDYESEAAQKDTSLYGIVIDSNAIEQLREYPDQYELARQLLYFYAVAPSKIEIEDADERFVLVQVSLKSLFEQLQFFARIHPSQMVQAASRLVYSDQPGVHSQASLVLHELIQRTEFGESNFSELMPATARTPLSDSFALYLFSSNAFGAFEFFNDYENRGALQKPEEFQRSRRTLVSLIHARRWSAVTRDPAVRPWTISPTPETSELFAELLASPIWWHRAFAGALCKDHIWGEFVTPEIYDSLLEDPDRRVQAIMKFGR